MNRRSVAQNVLDSLSNESSPRSAPGKGPFCGRVILFTEVGLPTGCTLIAKKAPRCGRPYSKSTLMSEGQTKFPLEPANLIHQLISKLQIEFCQHQLFF